MKKCILVVMVMGITLSLAGCAKAEKVQEEQRYAWPLGTASPEDTVTQIFAEKFAKEVYRLSDGTMKIQVYPNSTLGGDRELLESCQDGDIPFVVQNTAPQVSFMPETAVFDLPCAFGTIEEIREQVDSEPFYSLIEEVYQEGGCKLLGFADQGFRVMSSNQNIQSVNDFKGQKIRTMENSYHMDFWKCLNANPTPMTFSEVYIGLQQGTIDAQENPYEVIVSNRLYEQQDYLIETNHLPHLISLIVSDEFFESLSEEQQDVLSEASELAKDYARNASDERISDKIDIIEKSGTVIVSLEESLREEIREAAQPVYESVGRQVPETLINAYLGE